MSDTVVDVLLADEPEFKWIGPPGEAAYKPLRKHLGWYPRPRSYARPEQWRVLKRRWRQEYYVVNMREWKGKYFELGETEQSAFHKTAERFDTLEQAMLYFEMVKG